MISILAVIASLCLLAAWSTEHPRAFRRVLGGSLLFALVVRLAVACGPATEVAVFAPTCDDAGAARDAADAAPPHDAYVAPPLPTTTRCDLWCELSAGGDRGANVGPHSDLR